MSVAGIFWQFRLGKFRVQFESKIFSLWAPNKYCYDKEAGILLYCVRANYSESGFCPLQPQ